MRTKKWAIIFLLFAGITFFTAQASFAGCEVAALDALIETGGNAPGTKLSGPITVFFQLSGEETSGNASMFWFLRLRKGSEFYSFAGGPEPVTFPGDLLTVVPSIIEDFFINTVVSNLYPGCETAVPTDCPEIVLKSYDMDVDWEAPGSNNGLFYFIADIVVAIQD